MNVLLVLFSVDKKTLNVQTDRIFLLQRKQSHNKYSISFYAFCNNEYFYHDTMDINDFYQY